MIEKLVSDLPEVYQPIHGHPELSGQVSRSCFDRLEHVIRIHDALQRLLGRPLKVLDLGCAQGYFSFNLAERGAIVYGVNFLDKNVAVCNALAQENPALQVGFETGRVEEAIARLEPVQYDLVLGLSVFHHIVYEKGVDVVRAMLEHAAAQSGALVVELALREEPLYWAPAQPEDPRALLESIAFVHEIARHGTHLADISRPLFVASSRYWILEDQASRFDSWSLDPHGLAQGTHQASRRYFFSADRILKLYRFDHPRGEHNKTEFTKEVRFLQKPPPAFSAPALIAFGERETDAWFAMQRLSGRLLLDLLREGAKVDSRAVLLAVLKQLVALEAAGLYHDDVRTWNVLVAEDGTTHLIDYGSISSEARDCAWPGNPFLSFFIFVREVATGVVDDPDPLRTVTISPYGLPQPYRSWATSLWFRSLNEWSFRLMYQTLLETPTEMVEEPVLENNSAWMKAIEEAIQAQKLFVNHIRQRVDTESLEVRAATAEAESRTAVAEARAATAEAESRTAVAEARAATAEAESRTAVAEARAATAEAESRTAVAEVRAATAEAALETASKELHDVHQANHHHWLLAEARHQQLQALLGSTSWAVTAPLRSASSALRGLTPKALRLRARIFLQHAALYVGRRPRLKNAALKLLNHFPRLKSRLFQVVTGIRAQPAQAQNMPTDLAHISPRARQIYADLETAIERRQKENN